MKLLRMYNMYARALFSNIILKNLINFFFTIIESLDLQPIYFFKKNSHEEASYAIDERLQVPMENDRPPATTPNTKVRIMVSPYLWHCLGIY